MSLILTTSELVAAIRAVPLSITQVVSGDTFPVLTGGLVHFAGPWGTRGAWGLLDGDGGGRSGGNCIRTDLI